MEKLNYYLTMFIYALIRYFIIYLGSALFTFVILPYIGVTWDIFSCFFLMCAAVSAADQYIKNYHENERA